MKVQNDGRVTRMGMCDCGACLDCDATGFRLADFVGSIPERADWQTHFRSFGLTPGNAYPKLISALMRLHDAVEYAQSEGFEWPADPYSVGEA